MLKPTLQKILGMILVLAMVLSACSSPGEGTSSETPVTTNEMDSQKVEQTTKNAAESVDPDAQAFLSAVNDALSQAGHPIVFTASGYTINGDEKDAYLEELDMLSLYVDENGQPSSVAVWTKEGASQKVQEAARVIFTAAAPFFAEQFVDDAFLEAFFNMKNHAHYVARNSDHVYNAYGTYTYSVESMGAEYLHIVHETEDKELRYMESTNGEMQCAIGSNHSEVATPVFLEDYLAQLTGKYPDASVGDLNENPLSVEVSINGITASLKIRPADRAIMSIQGYIKNRDAGWQELLADLVALCGNGISRDKVLEQFDKILLSSHYAVGQGITMFVPSTSTTPFVIEINLEELPSTENFFHRSPSVTGGKFNWLDFAAEQSGVLLYDYTEAYLRDISLGISGIDFRYSETADAEMYDYKSIGVFATGPLDPEHYGFVTVVDENPHFVMYYNENTSGFCGLPEGYYYNGARPEEIRLLPVCLSTMCDSDITQQMALELFCLEMEPSRTLADDTVTFYCPGEVAHILVANTKTGDNTYYAMTKADFEDTYSDLDGFVAAWEGDTFLAAVKEAAKIGI